MGLLSVGIYKGALSVSVLQDKRGIQGQLHVKVRFPDVQSNDNNGFIIIRFINCTSVSE